MTAKPKSVRIRTYQVGFGDCFLLTFRYEEENRNVLIDFGSTGLPQGTPKTRMIDIAGNVKKECGSGRLDVVVATHRHQDHVSGFATNKRGTAPGNIIASLRPRLVIQPWTENPKLAPDAIGPSAAPSKRQSLAGAERIRALSTMHAVAALALKTAKKRRYLDSDLRDQLAFLGEENIANRSAVENLMNMARNKYVYAGCHSGLSKILPGVKVHVLGPPTLRQERSIAKQRSRDPDEFWHLQAQALNVSGADPAAFAGLFPDHIASRGPAFPIDARWLVHHARLIQANQLLQIVRILDNAMNNTSVILLFEVGEKLLLFPGDAQIENWSYALRVEKTRALLKKVNVYKVGHHGSLNATPKSLWELFQRRSKDPTDTDRLISLMSTMEGKHGHMASDTEVPRRALVRVLKSQSQHFSTQSLTNEEYWHDVNMDL